MPFSVEPGHRRYMGTYQCSFKLRNHIPDQEPDTGLLSPDILFQAQRPSHPLQRIMVVPRPSFERLHSSNSTPAG